jgi:uncharacterized membrane protein YheB (UPF0754 family)
MRALLEQTLQNVEFWKYVSIPFVAALVGWVTNWIAIKMTFLPLEFVGVRPIFGWQGIIPSKATKMAGIFVDKTMYKLGKLSELFEQMDPELIARHVIKYTEPRLDEYVDDIMQAQNPLIWENTPGMIKEQIYAAVRRDVPRRVEALMKEIGEKVEDLVDLKQMIVSQLERDKTLLNRLFLESGAAEFRFLVRSGAYFGFLFGLVQVAVWYFLPAWWVLPVFGLIVGYATNWIAINLIFRPLTPRRVGPWTIQGLFLRRQREVAEVWCPMVTREILTLRNIIDAMVHGPRGDRTAKLIRRHIRPVVDESVGGGGLGKALAQVAVGLEGYSQIKDTAGQKALDVSVDPFEDQVFNEERSQVVERLLHERMVAMSPEDFQGLLRPCFQEDEFKLILAGAVLGFGAGMAQLVFVFGGLS